MTGSRKEVGGMKEDDDGVEKGGWRVGGGVGAVGSDLNLDQEMWEVVVGVRDSGEVDSVSFGTEVWVFSSIWGEWECGAGETGGQGKRRHGSTTADQCSLARSLRKKTGRRGGVSK